MADLSKWDIGISIHALLAESDAQQRKHAFKRLIFLSTLSLRRATGCQWGPGVPNFDFYPRSPCGERQIVVPGPPVMVPISIHALLAESDCSIPVPPRNLTISIHALLAESDPDKNDGGPGGQFLSTLSLRRATYRQLQLIKSLKFLSTLSLRRATIGAITYVVMTPDFYPRSPCGERPAKMPRSESLR